MPTVTYFNPAGEEHAVDVPDGMSVMEGAVSNMIDGITADCGGACACATCHVHVDPEWYDRVGAPNETEADLLEFADNVTETSRLGCQVKVSDELDGLVVRIPYREI